MALKLKIAVTMIVLTAIGRPAMAQAPLAGTQPSIEAWSELPTLTTAMTLNKDKSGQTYFRMAVIFSLSESIGFEPVKALTQNTELLKKYFRYVQEANFSPADSSGKMNFALTVGIFTDHFSQSFDCYDQNETPTNWKRTCTENTANSNSILANAKIIMQCFELQSSLATQAKNSNREGVQCELDVSAYPHIPKNHFFVDNPTVPKIACGFLNNLTSYWAQLGLIAGHDAQPSHTEDYMNSDAYLHVMNDLQTQEKSILGGNGPDSHPIMSGWPNAPQTIPNFLYSFETENPSSGS